MRFENRAMACGRGEAPLSLVYPHKALRGQLVLAWAGAGGLPKIRATARKPSNFACVSCAPACNPAQVRPRSVACASKSMSPGRPHRPGGPAGVRLRGVASQFPWPRAQTGSRRSPLWFLISRRWSLICNRSPVPELRPRGVAAQFPSLTNRLGA